jgi:hypothetical protein
MVEWKHRPRLTCKPQCAARHAEINAGSCAGRLSFWMAGDMYESRTPRSRLVRSGCRQCGSLGPCALAGTARPQQHPALARARRSSARSSVIEAPLITREVLSETYSLSAIMAADAQARPFL